MGTGAMVCKRAGFEHANPQRVTIAHFMIHSEALGTKKISLNLDTVLRDVFKIINYIKYNALNSHLFTNFCKNNIQIKQVYQCMRKSDDYREATVYKGYCI